MTDIEQDIKNKEKITFIGDVHGYIKRYIDIAKSHHNTIQVGDMGIGFRGVESSLLSEINSDNHKFIHGNHDNPDECTGYPHFLGRYGTIEIAGLKIFFVSGAYSIDKWARQKDISWWGNEELNFRESSNAIDQYFQSRPDIIVSHDAPTMVKNELIRGIAKDYTSKMLQAMFDIASPKYWIFGHHHRSFVKVIGITTFRCLDELETWELNY